ncbi:MAG: hypothetical protein HKN50_07325 [Gammaproteobacteria bacterium]|nr:hypothetical protein [Gammaproteobacteria bacterium]
MYKVVDSNSTNSPALLSFLSHSQDNRVILPQYLAIEAYKRGSLIQVSKALETLLQFAPQVLILRSTFEIYRMFPDRKGIRKRFIDKPQSKSFVDFGMAVERAVAGDRFYVSQLEEMFLKAEVEIEKQDQLAKEMSEQFNVLLNVFTKDELKSIRSRSSMKRSAIEKIMELTIDTAELAVGQVREFRRGLTFQQLVWTYGFRRALCATIWLVDKISDGVTEISNLEKLRNDMIDLEFVTPATFYDGLISSDKTANRVYNMTVQVLEVMTKRRRG